MKTSIFVFNPYPSIGGADTTLLRFVKSVDFKKYNLTYISLTNINNFSKKIKFIKINSNSTFLSFFKIKKIINQDKSPKKIFFSMQYFVNVCTILFLRKIKKLKIFIYEVNHPIELNYSFSHVEFLKKIIIKFLVRKIYHKADLIAANCEELSKDISFMVRKKVETIYNPCFFKIMQARAKKKISKKINILNISRFEYQKDHLTLLKAIQNSKIKNKIKLNLVGYGSQESVIKNYANKNNIDCKIYKKKTKLSYFYRSNDIFILTSIYEGLPTVMIEAASHCMPIISSRFKSGSVEILGNGKFGYMFPVGNYKLLAKLLNNFNNKPELFHLKEKKCRKNLSKFSYTNNLKKFNISLKNLSNQII